MRLCLRCQAFEVLKISVRRGGIEGSWPPTVRVHCWKVLSQDPVPQLADRALRIGSASKLAVFQNSQVWAHFASHPRLAARYVGPLLLPSGGGRGCGMGVGPGLYFWARMAGEGWGPRQQRATGPTFLAGDTRDIPHAWATSLL